MTIKRQIVIITKIAKCNVCAPRTRDAHTVKRKENCRDKAEEPQSRFSESRQYFSRLYVFTGYVAITGVVNGTVDASAVKATKLALSGAVPVVGSILSDASETVLISAAFVKNSAGITGLFAILSLWIGPFLQIGVQYVFLKLTAGLCGVFGDTKASDLVKDFSSALGFLLAAVGTMCLLLLISTFCFMRGISG